MEHDWSHPIIYVVQIWMHRTHTDDRIKLTQYREVVFETIRLYIVKVIHLGISGYGGHQH